MKREEEDFRKYYEIIGKSIGEGGFGKVYKVKEKEKFEERAIKVMDKRKIRNDYFSNNLCKMSEEEIKILVFI